LELRCAWEKKAEQTSGTENVQEDAMRLASGCVLLLPNLHVLTKIVSITGCLRWNRGRCCARTSVAASLIVACLAVFTIYERGVLRRKGTSPSRRTASRRVRPGARKAEQHSQPVAAAVFRAVEGAPERRTRRSAAWPGVRWAGRPSDCAARDMKGLDQRLQEIFPRRQTVPA
jgi:hypothetical protein